MSTGAASDDGHSRGRSFRFMTTHLHGLSIDPAVDRPIQEGQAKELLAATTLWKEKNPSIRGGRRFDLVLYRGNVTVQDIKVVGD